MKLAVPRWQRRGWWQLGSSWTVEAWRGACPCCKRPIDARLSEPWPAPRPAVEARGRYAFVITLWGSSADYVLGAMVLGLSIKNTRSPHALVCLYTDDVPANFISLLSRLWDCRLVEHISACTEKLSYQDATPHRFDKVFTKLRVLQLVDFAKVLLLDIDLVVLANIDELFELRAPAALRRGMNDTRWPLKTGDPIDGRAFFSGRDSTKWSWGQGTGINAGVMLLQPNEWVFSDMLAEISDPSHPSHARGNGPEQDYLSRYWADSPWTYIGVEYNYQLHQMFFALHPKWANTSDRATMLKFPEQIKVVHFSGVPAAKPWHRILDGRLASYWPNRSLDAEYTRSFADEFLGHWLWIRKDRATWEDMPQHHSRSEMQDLYLGDDGAIYQRPWTAGDPPTLADIPREVTDGAMRFLGKALGAWFDCYEQLEQELALNLRRMLAPPSSGGALSVSSRTTPSTSQSAHTSGKMGIDGNLSLARNGREHHKSPHWKRHGAWWTELMADAQWEKNSVVCSGAEGRPFVSFCAGGVETFGEHDNLLLSGVFVKVAGHFSGRHFAPSGINGELDSALDSIRFWVQGVPVGAGVLVAIVRLEAEDVRLALEALAPLGVPQDVPVACRAFAAAGVRPDPNDGGRGTGWFGEKRGNASMKRSDASEFWQSCHASSDIAYASISSKLV